MLSQQLTQESDGSGKLVITAADQVAFAELASLQAELSTRSNMTTNGPIMVLPPVTPAE
jgi:hypothetical protein